MTRARVLLVEDDASTRCYVGMALEDLPVDLVEAGTLEEARQALAGGAFALLLSDLMLPDGSGLDLLAWLQADPALRGGARVVVLSAGVSTAVREQASALGAWRVLEKPVSLAALTECVAQALVEPASASAPAPAPTPLPRDVRATAIDAHFGGQAALYDAFRASSLTQFQADIDAGDAACRDGDVAALRRQAHNLKSVLLLLGADATSARAYTLEAAAASGAASITTLAPLWQDLRSAVLILGATSSASCRRSSA